MGAFLGVLARFCPLFPPLLQSEMWKTFCKADAEPSYIGRILAPKPSLYWEPSPHFSSYDKSVRSPHPTRQATFFGVPEQAPRRSLVASRESLPFGEPPLPFKRIFLQLSKRKISVPPPPATPNFTLHTAVFHHSVSRPADHNWRIFLFLGQFSFAFQDNFIPFSAYFPLTKQKSAKKSHFLSFCFTGNILRW